MGYFKSVANIGVMMAKPQEHRMAVGYPARVRQGSFGGLSSIPPALIFKSRDSLQETH